MTREELLKALTYIVSKCDNIINNKNYIADNFVQDTVEDIAEVCNMILDGKYSDILEFQSFLRSDFEEAATKWVIEREKLIREKYYPFMFDGEDVFDAFKAGAEWVIKQLKKE